MSKNLATLEKSQISELKPIFWSSVDKVRVTLTKRNPNNLFFLLLISLQKSCSSTTRLEKKLISSENPTSQLKPQLSMVRLEVL